MFTFGLIPSENWEYNLRDVSGGFFSLIKKNDSDTTIDIEGIGYVTHPYPLKTSAPYEQNWEKDFGFVADKYPLFATEFGFMSADAPGAHFPVISDEKYGRAIINYFKKKGISWAVWNFDPDWPPQLISDWNYTPTPQGAFFRDAMLNWED